MLNLFDYEMSMEFFMKSAHLIVLTWLWIILYSKKVLIFKSALQFSLNCDMLIIINLIASYNFWVILLSKEVS